MIQIQGMEILLQSALIICPLRLFSRLFPVHYVLLQFLCRLKNLPRNTGCPSHLILKTLHEYLCTGIRFIWMCRHQIRRKPYLQVIRLCLFCFSAASQQQHTYHQDSCQNDPSSIFFHFAHPPLLLILRSLTLSISIIQGKCIKIASSERNRQ